MRIVGEWHLGADGVSLPAVRAWVTASHGNIIVERFLVDTGGHRGIHRGGRRRHEHSRARRARPF
jgi:hypothetical protein